MKRIALLFCFAILATVGFAQTEATTISLAQANGTSTTWDGQVNIYRDASGNIVFEDINTGPVELRDLMTATGVTTFTEAQGSTITLTERLGVGTTVPSELIEASGDDNEDVSILATNTGTTSYSHAALGVKSGTVTGAIGAFPTTFDDWEKPVWQGNVVTYASTETAGLGMAALGTTSDIWFSTGGAEATNERMRIDQDGLVGIGTASPTYGLHIVGDSAASGGVWLERDTSGIVGPSINLACDTTDTSWTERTVGAGYLNFQTENSSGTMINVGTIQCNVTDRTTGTQDSNLAFYAYDSGAAADPNLIVTGTGVEAGKITIENASADSFLIKRDNVSGGAATFELQGKNSAGDYKRGMYFSGALVTQTAGAEDGKATIYTIRNGSAFTQLWESDMNADAMTWNPGGLPIDFIVEGDTNANLLFVDASTDRVGIGDSTPSTALEVNGTVTAMAFAGDGSALTGINASGSSRWLTIDTGDYTTTPTSTSELAMSDTSEIAKGEPLRYTIGGTAYYGVCVDLASNTSVTVTGAPLSGNVTALEVGQPEQVVPLSFFVAGYYSDATTTNSLESDLNYFHYWQQGAARLVAVRAVHSADDGTANPVAEITIGGTADITTQTVTVTFPTITTPVVAVNTATYDVQPGERIEIAATKVGTGDAANLSITGLFVLE